MILTTGHTCDGGNRTLRWSQFCDGIIDCHDRFDEEGSFCKLCVNNLYSCSPKDDIRCDLACKMLHYVPCQTIQDRRACARYPPYLADENVFFQWFERFKYYIVTAVLVLLVSLSIVMLCKYICRLRQAKSSIKAKQSTNLSDICDNSDESDTLSSHIYEQCYEPPPYEVVQKHSLIRTYYEHSV
ncbi:unnamed protein product [Adineta ricciae]|uniref:Uncharacterized protein n=1 Tax=Adineta ricciae TaxID=249248 RepID=A0A816CYT0_ADIRI|nr:unnamed protein product [Adineta ricciae]